MWKKYLPYLVLFCLTSTFIGFGLQHLGKFHTADEDLWFANPTTGRIHTYWDALLSGDWERTRINDKPGITTAIISGPGLLFDTNPDAKVIQKGSYYRISDPVINEQTAFFFRLPMLLTNMGLIIALFFLTRYVTRNEILSLAFAIFLFLSPTLLGISQIVNPDSTLWSLTFLSFLALIAYVRHRHWSLLLLTSLTAGGALLSKYTAVFLIIYALFLLIAHTFFFGEHTTKESFRKENLSLFLSYPLFLLGVFFLFAFALPATFLHPEYLYNATFGFENSKNMSALILLFTSSVTLFTIDTLFLNNRIFWFFSRILRKLYPFLFALLATGLFLLFLSTTFNWAFGNILHLSGVTFDQARASKFQAMPPLKQIFFEARPLVYTVTPIALLLCLYALGRWMLQFRKYSRQFLPFSLLTFFWLFYVAVLSQKLLVDTRYGIILYPALFLIASFGFFYAYRDTQKILPIFSKNTLLTGTLLLLVLCNLYSLTTSVPFYFNYTNSLLPKDESITTAWGYGGYEAAQYLNALPNARDLSVWVDYEGFCNFFVGKCIKGSGINNHEENTFEHVDYYVVSRRGRQIQKKIWMKIKATQIEKNPLWKLSILGREANSVEIYQRKPDAPEVSL